MSDQTSENNSAPELKVNTKTLLVVRHAKSSWESGIAADFDRPLNDRGKRDAPVMAARLKDKKIMPDAFVSSPANRAFTTAGVFCDVFGLPEKKIITIPSLYHAAPETFFKVISELDNKFETVAIFSHNPGITAFANMLTDNIHVDNMPTCGIFGVEVLTNSWANFKESTKTFLLFDYPKNG